MRLILSFLSLSIVFFISCTNTAASTKEELKVTKAPDPKIELIDRFFQLFKNWKKENMDSIQQFGDKISEIDKDILFFPQDNQYEKDAFIFSSKNKESLHSIISHPYLNEIKPATSNNYKVWRREIDNVKILDFSIEPHPILGWIFAIRFRGQE